MRIIDSLIKKIMDDYGITKEHIDKVKSIIDQVDIKEEQDKTIVTINTKNITIIIDK